MLQDVEELVLDGGTLGTIEVSTEPLYCICQQPWDKYNRRFMIQCDNCKSWFHGSCIGLEEQESHEIERYHCSKCEPLVGPSQRRENGRKPVKAGTKMFIDKLKEKAFTDPEDTILRLRGQSLTLPFLINKGFNRPIIVEETDGLGLKVPTDKFTVLDVEKYVGSDHTLDVIDVEKQTDIKMTMKEFAEYFTDPNRTKLYNLISLEFSKTPLGAKVLAPEIARKLDWVATSWPRNLPEDLVERPEVSKYCLISAKDSYTDFHIDFGGTSVWYHVLWGEKIFYLIEPTPGNLSLYSQWMASIEQYESFFADSVDHCYRCVLKKGQTLFIPTGWIHAVLTVSDSLVFGGNFLHSLNMDLQLQIYDIEKKLNVPSKYLYPGFEATHWFAARRFVDDLECLNKIGHVPQHILRGSKALLLALRLWHADKTVTGPEPVSKCRRECIPPTVKPVRLLKDLSHEVKIAEKNQRSLNDPKPKVDAPQDTQVQDPIQNQSEMLAVTSESKSSENKDMKLWESEKPETKDQDNPQQPSTLKLKLRVPSIALDEMPSSATSKQSRSQKVLPGLKLKLSSLSSKEPKVVQSNYLPNLRLSVTGGEARVEIIEPSRRRKKGEDSDGYDSDVGLKIDTDDEAIVPSESKNGSHHSKKKQHKKRSTNRNLDLERELEGTVDGINELIKSSDYKERIKAFSKDGSALVKDSFQDMLEMGEKIGGQRGRGKGKRKLVMSNHAVDSYEYVADKVHQDEDFIYLPLAGSDDEGKSSSKRKKYGKDDDSNWSPGVKVGALQKREHQPSRLGAKRKHVEKGLEEAAAKLTLMEEKRIRHKNAKALKSSDRKCDKLQNSLRKPIIKTKVKSPQADSSKRNDTCNNSGDPASKAANQARKPKKGMATPKQRLGKILGIHKYSKF